MKTIKKTKPIGAVLEEAGLVSKPQIDVALRDQAQSKNLLFGEILALRGWLKQETADFFAKDWVNLLEQDANEPIGQYFKKAGLLNDRQIQEILATQKQGQTWIRFGALAVFKGYIKQSTLDFFLKYLSANLKRNSAFYARSQQKANDSKEKLSWQIDRQNVAPKPLAANPKAKAYDGEEIPWID